MASKSRNTLKSEFVSGTAATQSKFEDIFDSHFNVYEDSVLLGPTGVTGTNGLIGPEGATHYNGMLGPDGATHYHGLVGPSVTYENGLVGPSGATHYLGLWLDNTGYIPAGGGSTGQTGQTIINSNILYICVGLNTWRKVIGVV